jgi:putative ABC transport system permease protein
VFGVRGSRPAADRRRLIGGGRPDARVRTPAAPAMKAIGGHPRKDDRVFRVWRMAPWVRAPFLLLRRAGVAIALIAAAFVAALPAATAAPFLSSSANATLHTQIGLTCPASVGDVINYDMGLYGADDYANPLPVYPPPSRAATLKADQVRESKIGTVAASAGGLSAPQTVWHATNSKVQIGQQSVAVTSMTLPDFADHVHRIAGPSGSGVWIPDGFANAYHIRVGDPFVYTSLGGAPTKLRVAAIYTDLRGDPSNPAFCSMHDLIFGPRGAQLANSAVAPIVLMDQATFLTGVVPYHGKSTINFALADAKMPVDQTPHVTATIKTVNRTFATLMGACQGCQSSASQLTAFAIRAQLARTGIKPTVLPITAAGVLVGLVVVGAAAVFWVLRRRRELTVLSAHGMGSASLGVKAVLEALPALLTGAALAWVGGWWLVHTAGPDPQIARSAIIDSLRATIVALLAAIVVVGVAAALRARTLTDERRVRHRLHLGRWPWELLIIGGAVWAAISFGSATVTRDAPGGDGGLVVQVPPKLLIVPLLITVGCLMLIGRLVTLALRARRTGGGGGPEGRARGSRQIGRSSVVADNRTAAAGHRNTAGAPVRRARSMIWYLGWHRVAREAAVVAVLAGATTLPIALATYGDAVTRSVQATVDGEAKLLVGADVVVGLKQPVPVPAAFGNDATTVLRLTGVSIAGNNLNLYAVDPAQFSKVAFWNDQIDGKSLSSILAPLSAPHQPGTPFPAVTSADVPSGVQAPSWGFATSTRYDLATYETLPAEQGGYKSLIVTKESLGTEAAQAQPQMWIRGDPAAIRAKLATLHLPVVSTSSVDDVYSGTVFQPLTYTFQYLTALSILTGVVTIVGLLLYVEARAPGHRRGYVIARRMGLRARTHRRALLVELALPLTAGLGLGLGLAMSLTYAFSTGFDVDPTLPPHTLITLPTVVIVGIGVAIAIVAVLASSFAQLRVGRANPSEVLRDTV